MRKRDIPLSSSTWNFVAESFIFPSLKGALVASLQQYSYKYLHTTVNELKPQMNVHEEKNPQPDNYNHYLLVEKENQQQHFPFLVYQ